MCDFTIRCRKINTIYFISKLRKCTYEVSELQWLLDRMHLCAHSIVTLRACVSMSSIRVIQLLCLARLTGIHCRHDLAFYSAAVSDAWCMLARCRCSAEKPVESRQISKTLHRARLSDINLVCNRIWFQQRAGMWAVWQVIHCTFSFCYLPCVSPGAVLISPIYFLAGWHIEEP